MAGSSSPEELSPPPKPVARPPPSREVARPVANLGNTCYMNAVLQALAHAPELCMAMDVEPHYMNCPIYIENAQKRRSSPSSSPDAASFLQPKPPATRKSRRSSGKRSPTQSNGDNECKFCTLCEVEQHLTRVHTSSNNRDKPVAPYAFVGGFNEHVAPWFKLGVQEDSHEFLRLLIDAMQRSCKQARSAQENPQDTPPEQPEKDNEDAEDQKKPEDAEYPFQLFRGTVESNVTCESCAYSSSTLDPIEDIGLDVTPVSSSDPSGSPPALADVATAFQRFARAEALDAGYKCEKCGKVGRATKQSRLASIPPILTLHLKRFRYGETKTQSSTNGQPPRRSGRSSEVSQLLGTAAADFYTGKSGSAKIEGHSKFEQIFDLKPYLTEDLQVKHSNMFCRLFAVLVHAGKNSHSGHYITYVRNVAKNEWWKMDDARVTIASYQEVVNAEAYMLFYRVVEHPFAIQLRNQSKKLQDEYKEFERKEQEQKQKQAEAQQAALAAAAAAKAKEESQVENLSSVSKSKASEASATRAITPTIGGSVKRNTRKRKVPEFSCGEEWARAHTNLSDLLIENLSNVEQSISDNVHFKPEFFKSMTEQVAKGNAKVGHGPSSGVCEDDIVGGADIYKRALVELLYELHKRQEEQGSSLLKKIKETLSTSRSDEPLNIVASMVDGDADNFL